MSWLLTAVTIGITAFAATNIDDLIVLMLFFSEVDGTFRARQIVVGQYLGFAALIIASLPGFFGGLLVPKAWTGLLGLLPIIIGISHLVSHKQDGKVQAVTGDFSTYPTKRPVISSLAGFLSPQTYKVAAVTIANGADNIGIYVPLFASSDWLKLGVILSVFFLLIGIWCYAADQFAHHPWIAPVLSRYGKPLVPFVLISLGLFILIESGTLKLLSQ